MLPSIRKQVLHHDNAVEQTNWKTNATGTRTSLLECILRYVVIATCWEHRLMMFASSEIIDKADVSQFNARTGHGIIHIQRNVNLEQRFTTAHRREQGMVTHCNHISSMF